MKFLIGVILTLLVCSGYSQHRSKTGVNVNGKNSQQDTLYIKRYADKIIVKLDVDSDYDRYHIKGSGFNYDIRPNAGVSKLISFNYRFAYIAVSYLPRVIAPNKWEDTRGKTSGLGTSFGLTTPHWIGNIELKGVNGFYLYNTQDYVSGWQNKDPYIQFPELKTWMIRGSLAYKVNPNYSIRAIQTQTEAQRKSSSSFIPGINYNYYEIDNKTTAASTSQRSRNLELMAQASYYGTVVINRQWYLSAGAGIAGGVYHTWLLTRLPTENVYTEITDGIFRGILNSGVGYNGEQFIAGAEFLYYQSFSGQGENKVEMVFTRTAFQVFVGYRLRAPRFIDSGMDKFENFFKLHK